MLIGMIMAVRAQRDEQAGAFAGAAPLLSGSLREYKPDENSDFIQMR
jgi:hypothetical protein